MTETNGTPIVELEGVTKLYRQGALEVAALRGLTLSIARGEFTTLCGPSGSGKTTALNLIGALDRPTAGSVRLEGRDRVYLLFDWLHELLVTFETRRLVLSEFRVRVSDTGLAAEVRGEELDPDRHRLLHEVKAITYHGLKLEQTAAGWQAEVIVDI